METRRNSCPFLIRNSRNSTRFLLNQVVLLHCLSFMAIYLYDSRQYWHSFSLSQHCTLLSLQLPSCIVWRFCFSFYDVKLILAWLCPRRIFHILSRRFSPSSSHTMIFLLTLLLVVHNYVFITLVNVNCYCSFYSHWGQYSGLIRSSLRSRSLSVILFGIVNHLSPSSFTLTLVWPVSRLFLCWYRLSKIQYTSFVSNNDVTLHSLLHEF